MHFSFTLFTAVVSSFPKEYLLKTVLTIWGYILEEDRQTFWKHTLRNKNKTHVQSKLGQGFSSFNMHTNNLGILLK